MYLFRFNLTLVKPVFCIVAAVFLWASAAAVNGSRITLVGTESPLMQKIYSLPHVKAFYKRRNYRPAWQEHQFSALMSALSTVSAHGLNLRDYHYYTLNYLKPDELEVRDVLATDAYLLFASHLFGGKVNPQTIDPNWNIPSGSIDFVAYLEQALATNSIRQSLTDLAPSHHHYRMLQKYLLRLRASLDESSHFELNRILETGTRHPAVPAIRRILVREGDLYGSATSDVYDVELRRAVTTFQYRHGLEPDGKLGPKTQQFLNQSIPSRINQVRANLERWRWLPEKLHETRLVVNIAGFHLDVIHYDKPIKRMDVIVGKAYRKTPVFTDELEYFIVNPYWLVPRSIALKDLLPGIKANTGFLTSHGYEIIDHHGQIRKPDSIDWHSLSADYFPLRIRQKPGEHNALGKVKFMFPNPHQVYLHDTPERQLFRRGIRTFSSGCIRLEDPWWLAIWINHLQKLVDSPTLKTVWDSTEEKRFDLKETLPVYILYWTTWVDPDGSLQWRDDIYHRDSAVTAALFKTNLQ